MMYKITEIFRTIQGEGYWSGRPAVFVRFSGCNLNCSWCDTDHSANLEMKRSELIDVVKGLRVVGDMIVLTGGEPLLQVSESTLWNLSISFPVVAIETNGTQPLPSCTVRNNKLWITVSPKSTEDLYALNGIVCADELKIVVPGDGWTYEQLDKVAKVFPQEHKFIQPQDGYEGAVKWAIDYVMRNPQWRLSTQIHKSLGLR